MKVIEQIDAMEASAVNPYKYLAATRVLACILMLPLLTLAADFFGIVLGWIATILAEPMSLQLFLKNGFKEVAFDGQGTVGALVILRPEDAGGGKSQR